MADQHDETPEREPVEAEGGPVPDDATLLAAREALAAQMQKGANWFFWIAGLSVVNSVILLMEGDRHFVVGLGVTQLVNAIALEVARQNPGAAVVGKGVAFVFTLFASAVVAAFGLGARRGMGWVFLLGMGLYLIDGLLYVVFLDWMSVAFHAFCLWCIFGGFRASRQLKALDEAAVLEAG